MGSPLHQNSTRIELMIHDHNIAVVIMIFGCLWLPIPDFTHAHTKGEGHRCYYCMKVIVFIEMVEPVLLIIGANLSIPGSGLPNKHGQGQTSLWH